MKPTPTAVSPAYGIPGLSKLVGHNLEASHRILARKVGVRRETIVFLEKGKYNPSLKLAYDIAQVFCMKIEEVFVF